MLSRRTLIGSGIALAGATTTLAGCRSNEGNGTGGTGDAGSGALPDHIPYEGVSPDIPAGEDGIPAGFFTYPGEPVQVGETPLGITDPISALLVGSAPAMKPAENSWYQLITDAIGTDFDFSWGGWTEYGDKYQVMIASGDVPDLVMMQTVAQFPKLLDTLFTDLTDFLGGDKIADYPGLASIPTPSWKATQLNGRVWGIPQPRPPAGRVLSIRNDLAEERGVGRNPTIGSGEDLIDLMTELTRPGDKQFAMGANPEQWLLPMIATMTGAPNGYIEQDGVFVHQWETPEFRQALEESVRIMEAGLLHPLSVSEGANFDWWRSGATTLYCQAFSGWANYAPSFPEWDLGALILPRWDGGGPAPVHLSEAAYSSWVGVSQQASDDRVRDLLRVADYIASPFGTQEFLDVNYGVEGTHYDFRGTDPIPDAEAAEQEKYRSLLYAGSTALSVLYVPGQQQTVQDMHDHLSAVMPGGIEDASTGLYSETSVTKGATARRGMSDVLLGILAGRKKIDDFDSELATYREAVGRTISEELAAAKAESE